MIYRQAYFGVLGLLIGDALGVPYEFTKPEGIPPYEDIKYKPPQGFKRAHNVFPGTWSDDGSQALCVLDALLDVEEFHEPHGPSFLDRVGQKLLAWRRDGLFAVDGKVFDIGVTTNLALNRLASGIAAIDAGMVGEQYKSNGSLMRALPTAFMEGYDDDYILRAAMGQSKVTHAELEPMLACGIYALWARGVADGNPQAWDDAFERAYKVLPKGAVSAILLNMQRWQGICSGSGYVVDSLYSAKYAVEKGTDFESTVKLAIQFGNDTDTTAAIAGGIAGIMYQSIPGGWIAGLRGLTLLERLLPRLHAMFHKVEQRALDEQAALQQMLEEERTDE